MRIAAGVEGAGLSSAGEESDREEMLRTLHDRYSEALERNDWNAFTSSYRSYLELYLEDDPHYADPVFRNDYIEAQLEKFRPRFHGAADSTSERLISVITWSVFVLISAVIAYFLLGGPMP
jgi:hypothetical protein